MCVCGSVVCRVVILLRRSKVPTPTTTTTTITATTYCCYHQTKHQSIKALDLGTRSRCTISPHGTRFVLGPGSTLALFIPSLALAPCALAGPFYPWPLAPDPGPGRGRGRSRLQSTFQVASDLPGLHTHTNPVDTPPVSHFRCPGKPP